MFFRMIYEDQLAHASYLVGCQKTGEAIVVDPRRDVDAYLSLAKKEGFRVVATAETHVHADFVSGARELAEQANASVYVSGAGGREWTLKWLSQPRSAGGSYAHRVLHDGDEFDIGGISFRALHTPGHTPEHLSYLLTDKGSGATSPMGIFSGDFVFVGDLGRPDLLEKAVGVSGSQEPAAEALRESAQRFLELADYVQVWPAHGAGSACGKSLGAVPQSTVGYERLRNGPLQLADEAKKFVANILAAQPEPPSYFSRMKKVNVDGPAVLGGLPAPKQLSGAEATAAASGDSQVIDMRPWGEFRVGHLPGALCAPFDKAFTTIVGSYADPDKDVLLCCASADQVAAAVRCCVRVGIDRVTGFVLVSDLEGQKLESAGEIDVAELKSRIASGDYEVLDVRRAEEFAAGHMPGAANIAHVRLADELEHVPKGKPLLVSCRSGARSARATAFLRQKGYDATNVAGGFLAWEKAGEDIVRES